MNAASILTILFYSFLLIISGILIWIGIRFGKINSISRYKCLNNKCVKDPDGLNLEDCKLQISQMLCARSPVPVK